MERYINKDNVSDITYMSELTPPSCFRKKAGGINSPKQLTFTQPLRARAGFTSFRKLWAH